MKLPDIHDIRINKRIYIWSESMSCKRGRNWNYKVTEMSHILEMHSFSDSKIHIIILTKLFQIKCTKFFTDLWSKVVNKDSRKKALVVISSAHMNYLNKYMPQNYMRHTYFSKVIEVPWLKLGVVRDPSG